MHSFLETYEDLTTSEKKCLKYIIDNFEEIPYLNIRDFSDKAYISKTVIVNLSQKLGFSGFKELKYHISNQIYLNKQEKSQNSHSELTVQEDLESRINKTLSLIVEKEINRSVQLILNAKNIFIIARGTSKSVGYYLEHLLFSLGIQCFFIQDYNLSKSFTSLVDEKDLIILISLSGNTARVVDTAKRVQLNNAKMVSMTGFQSNPLTSYADCNLFCYSDIIDTKIDDSASRIGFFILIDMLIDTIKIYKKEILL